MSNPARPPTELTAVQLALSTAPDTYLKAGFADLAKKYKKLEMAQVVLYPLDMDMVSSFFIPKEHTVSEAVLAKSTEALATAKAGIPQARVRSRVAKQVQAEVWAQLPSSGLFSQEALAPALRDKVYVDGGTEATLGRLALAYPKRNFRPKRPVLRDEAEAALARSGIDLSGLPSHALRPFPVVPSLSGEQSVSVNPHSDNGFPVLGTWSDPGAAKMCADLAHTLEAELRSCDDVDAWLREKEKTQPYLAAVKGKAKADYYSEKKVAGCMLRFYNVFPRHMMLLMQKATQVLEMYTKHINNSGSHSGIGVSLVRGGGADMVAALESQLAASDEAYVHVGDDSWVAIRRDGQVVMFALDCSNFDLTQHGDTTREVHGVLKRELERIEPKSAALWHAYARERVTVVTGSIVRRFRHAGPSGMPLQSKVNDVLMDVMINRTLDALRGGKLTEERVAAAVEEAGSGMGFVVRLEQYSQLVAENLVDALGQVPFLFIGYYFHVRAGQVRVHADIGRTLAQLPYPSLKWARTEKELVVTEAMRVGSIALNLGMPSVGMDGAFDAFRSGAVALIEKALGTHGDVMDPKLRWAVQEVPWGEPAMASLSGLLKAVRRDAGFLWLTKEVELVSISEFLPLSWADEAEAEEEAELEEVGGTAVRPALEPGLRRVALRKKAPSTHPVTMGNDGRMPPTAVWGPDKAPRMVREEVLVTTSRRARRRDGILAREFAQALDDEMTGYESGEFTD